MMTRLDLQPRAPVGRPTIAGWCVGCGAVFALLLSLWTYESWDRRASVARRRLEIAERHLQRDVPKVMAARRLEARRSQLHARMRALEARRRSSWSAICELGEVIRSLPSGVVLEEVRRSGGDLALRGRARDEAALAAMLVGIADSGTLEVPVAVEIRRPDTDGRASVGARHFTVEAISH